MTDFQCATEQKRIADALERIADALEKQNAGTSQDALLVDSDQIKKLLVDSIEDAK